MKAGASTPCGGSIVPLKPRPDRVLKRADAVDDGVRLAALKRSERRGQIVERRVREPPLVQKLRARRMRHRRQPAARQVGLLKRACIRDPIRRHLGDDRGRQDRHQRDAREHPKDCDDPAAVRLRRLVAVADRGHGHDRPIDAVAERGDRQIVARPHRPLGEPHRNAHRQQKPERHSNQRTELAHDRGVGPEGGQRAALLAHGDRHAGTVRRIAEIDPREPLGRDRDRADAGVVVPALDAVDERLHLRDRDQPVLAAQNLRHAAPQVHADAVDRPVRFDMAIGRHVVDRDSERRLFGFGGGDQGGKGQRLRKTPHSARDDRREAKKNRWRHQPRRRNRGGPNGSAAGRRLRVGPG